MKFNEEHKVVFETMNDTEKQAYHQFLSAERERHRLAVFNATEWLDFIDTLEKKKGGFEEAYAQFYQSATKRHMEDIRDIDVLLKVIDDGS